MNAPRQRILDCHHHWWGAVGDMHADTYQLEAYCDDVAGLYLAGSVFVECLTHYADAAEPSLASVGETAFAARLAREAPAGSNLGAAIVGYADIGGGIDLDAVVAAHSQAAEGRLRGFRRNAAWDEDHTLNHPVLGTRRGLLTEPGTISDVRRLGEMGLMFETWLYHPQIDELAALADAAPQTTIVLNHGGNPQVAGRHTDAARVLEDWREAMARLAERPNVVVKIGGLSGGSGLAAATAGLGEGQWTREGLEAAIAPLLDWMIACFGAERCLFESNFPVDKERSSMATLVGAYEGALTRLAPEDRAAIFCGNAARLYRISA